jgi:cephalosporin-C deacetylase-like acetyl esterase
MRKGIEFKSRGITCRGWLYVPDKGKAPFPVVVMAGGWCYVKEIVMPQYADMFAKAGLATILFDYRNFGESDGEPRQHINPYEQIEDYKNGMCFVETLDEVDSERIGIWGISYSGGHVLIIGATDSRVKCIVGVVPCVDGWSMQKRNHSNLVLRELRNLVMEDRRERFNNNGKGGTIPMSSLDPNILSVWPMEELNDVFMKLQQTVAPNHKHWSTIESLENIWNYNVFGYLKRILDVPTMLVVGEEDDITPWDDQINAFNEIATPKKRLVVIPKSSHMTLYSNKTHVEIAAEASTSWLVEHLIKPYE